MVPFSVLDLAPIVEGSTPAAVVQEHARSRAARRALGLSPLLARRASQHARHRQRRDRGADRPTSRGGTTTIRVGAGGIMLPNHAPLVIAEQFGTLESLFPGRIDLGLGRAPGTDPLTTGALRRTIAANADDFPRDVARAARRTFAIRRAGQLIRAVPGAGLKVPIWILGSSLYGAQLAAALGLPYAFASHFAPQA